MDVKYYQVLLDIALKKPFRKIMAKVTSIYPNIGKFPKVVGIKTRLPHILRQIFPAKNVARLPYSQ